MHGSRVILFVKANSTEYGDLIFESMINTYKILHDKTLQYKLMSARVDYTYYEYNRHTTHYDYNTTYILRLISHICYNFYVL